MFSDKRCEIKCVFPYVLGIRIMSIHIDMYLRLSLHVQIRLYYVLPYKAKISARDRFYIGLMYCVLRTNHAKFAKETSANFRNIQHQKVHTFFWNRVYKPLRLYVVIILVYLSLTLYQRTILLLVQIESISR